MRLEHRLEVLERAADPVDRLTIIVNRLTDPARPASIEQRATCDDLQWLRSEGESAVAFRDRAVRDARELVDGIPVLLMFPARSATSTPMEA